MDADYDIYEIVKVLRDYWLLDAEHYQRNYFTNHGEPLMPGYYVVSWPEAIRIRRFDEHAAFHGPYKNRQQAQTFRNAMQKHKYTLIPLTPKWALNRPEANPMSVMKVA